MELVIDGDGVNRTLDRGNTFEPESENFVHEVVQVGTFERAARVNVPNPIPIFGSIVFGSQHIDRVDVLLEQL